MGLLGDPFENGRVERFRSDGQAVEHRAEEFLQRRLARGRIERSEFRPDGRQAFGIFHDVVEANELDVDELENGEASEIALSIGAPLRIKLRTPI